MALELLVSDIENVENNVEETLLSAFDGDEVTAEDATDEPDDNEDDVTPEAEEIDEDAPDATEEEAA